MHKILRTIAHGHEHPEFAAAGQRMIGHWEAGRRQSLTSAG